LRWLPALAWMAVIFWLSSGELPPTGGFEIPDKVAHFGAWFILGGLAWWGAARLGLGRATVVAIIVPALYGAVDEIHQRFVPGRSADVRDWLADAAGAVCAAVALALIAGRRQKPPR
jgi:VanZ family protein